MSKPSEIDPLKIEQLRDQMRPLHNALRVQTSVKFEMEELAGWHPHRVHALLRGIGEVVNASTQNSKEPTPTEVNQKP